MLKLARNGDTSVKLAMVAGCDLSNVKVVLSIGTLTSTCDDVSKGSGTFLISKEMVATLGGAIYYADLKSYRKHDNSLIDAEVVQCMIVDELADTKGFTTVTCTIPYEGEDITSGKSYPVTPTGGGVSIAELNAAAAQTLADAKAYTDQKIAEGGGSTPSGDAATKEELAQVSAQLSALREEVFGEAGGEGGQTLVERIAALEEASSDAPAVVFDSRETFGTDNLRVNRVAAGSVLVDAVIDALDAGKKVFLKCGDYKFSVISTVDSRAHTAAETRFRGFVCESVSPTDISAIGGETVDFVEERLVVVYHPVENKTYTYYSTDAGDSAESQSLADLRAEVQSLKTALANLLDGKTSLDRIVFKDKTTGAYYALAAEDGGASGETIAIEQISASELAL